MSYGGQVASVFNQLAGIYAQMGKGIPGGGVAHLKGKQRLNVLQSMVGPAMQELSNYRNQQLQDQMMQAQRAAQSQLKALQNRQSNPKTLQATLGSTEAGVRGRRSRTQKRAQEQGVRNADQLQAGPFTTPGGTTAAVPYGSSINLA